MFKDFIYLEGGFQNYPKFKECFVSGGVNIFVYYTNGVNFLIYLLEFLGHFYGFSISVVTHADIA